MIRGIVFDCFGVLAGKGFWDVYNAAGGDSVKDNDFISEMVGKENRGEITGEAFAQAMARKLGLSLEGYRMVVLREEQANTPLLEYIRLQLHSRYKLGVLSNASAGVVAQRLDPSDYALFTTVIESAATPWAKPDREIFELMAKSLGISFDEMVFIDDLEIFTGPASEYGIHAIRYTHLDALQTALAELLD